MLANLLSTTAYQNIQQARFIAEQKRTTNALLESEQRYGIEIYQQQKNKIDLFIHDMTMPKMDGAETYKKLRRIDPNIHIAISSGYSESEVNTHFHEQRPCAFIPKPYTLDVLRQRLQILFDLKH